MSKLKRPFCLFLLFVMVWGVAGSVEFQTQWERSTGLRVLHQPVISELNGDDKYEIVLSDVEGKLKAIHVEDGKTVWMKRLKGVKITAPVVGNFTGDGTLDIVVGGNDGYLYLLDGASGTLLLSSSLGANLVLPPTVVKRPETDGVILGDEEGRLYFVGFSSDPALHAEVIWWVHTGGQLCQPAVVGRFLPNRAAEEKQAIIGALNAEVWMVELNPSRTIHRYSHLSRRPVTTMIAVGDLTGDGLDEAVFGDGEGYLNCLSFKDGKLGLLWGEKKLLERSVTDPLIFDLDGDEEQEVFVATPNNVYAFRNDGSQNLWMKPYGALHRITTQPVLVLNTQGKGSLLFGDAGKNLVLFNLEAAREEMFYSFGRDVLSFSPLIFDANSDGYADFFLISSTTKNGYLVSSDINVLANGVYWQTQGGTAERRGGVELQELKELLTLKEELYQKTSSLIIRTRQALQRKDWEEASYLLDQLSSLNPLSVEATRLRRSLLLHQHFTIVIGVAAFVCVLVAFLLLKVVRLWQKHKTLRRAEHLLQLGNLKGALEGFMALYRRYPRDDNLAFKLAILLNKAGEFSTKHEDVFEHAYRLAPENKTLLKALAICYVHRERQDETALEIYRRAYELFEDKSQLAFLLGRIYRQQQQLEKAGKYLREALRTGMETEEVYGLLGDIYMRLGFYHPKALEVFAHLFPRRRSDPEFLKAYTQTLRQAKRINREAQAIYGLTLEQDPTFLPALVQMAKAELEQGNYEAALNYSQQILERNPEEPEGLFLLSQCYLMENRIDSEALKTYHRTLEHFPDDADLLRMLSLVYYNQQRFDEESLRLYRRSAKVNPNDINALLALAHYAQRHHDSRLGIEVLERLQELKKLDDPLVLELAQAYKQLRCTEEKAIDVYRNALSLKGRDEEMLLLLGRALSQAGKTDAAAIKFYEDVIQSNPKEIQIGRQLAKGYLLHSEYEKCQKLCHFLLKYFPDEIELEHLVAQAEICQNNLDEAIKYYRHILERQPDDERALVNLALAYAQKRRTDPQAERLYLRALESNPESDLLHRQLARVHAERGYIELAVKELRHALKLKPQNLSLVVEDIKEMLAANPGSLDMRWFSVELFVEHNRLREAVEMLQNIFEIDPQQLEPILNSYNEILTKDPLNAAAYLKKGTLLKVKGYYEGARQALERAFELTPQDSEVQQELAELYELMLEEEESSELHFRLGVLYYRMGEFDKAIGCFQKTAQNFRWEADSIKMLGRTFMAKGMLDLALQEFKRLSIDEELKELLYELAQRYEHKKDLVGAKTVYKHLFAADIDYKDVREKFELFSGSTSDPLLFQKTTILNSLSERAKRRYELQEEIGRGAMGIVYKAQDNELEETVALKILPDTLSNDPDAVARFKQEARSARRLAHPYIVRIHDIGEELGRKYISMEFIDGIDLKRMIKKQGKLSLSEVVSIGKQTAEALNYAHTLGVIHRDIKSANILLTQDGQVKITDFGIAKLKESSEVTLAGSVIGTPLYMSPEQVQGIPADHRADIYSFGILLYELITGAPPFVEGDLAYQHLYVQPKPLEGVPEGLSEIVMKCLAKRREDRWQSADEVREAFERFEASLTPKGQSGAEKK